MKTTGMIALLLIACLAAPVQAKCPQERYELKGQIAEAESGKIVPGAKVYIFLDEEQSPNPAGYSTEEKDYFRTDDSGNFIGVAYFDTYSGRSWRLTDACTGTPKKIQIFVIADGYHTFRFTASVEDLTRERGVQLLVVPRVLLKRVTSQQQKDR